jgi:MYXO-CTERM domain-containing protein
MHAVLKWPRLIALVSSIVFYAALPAEATPILSLVRVPSDNGVEVAVQVDGASDVFAYQFSVNFDPTVLEALTVTEGPFLAAAGPTFFDPGTIDNGLGSISFMFDTLLGPVAGASGSGILAYIDFDPLRQAFTTLSLSDVFLVDSSVNEIPTETVPLTSRVPEPPTTWLAGIALLAAAVVRRRRRGARD